jgi:hypothetical protein
MLQLTMLEMMGTEWQKTWFEEAVKHSEEV